MKIRTNVKAGGTQVNHNEKQAKSLTVKTNVKAGGIDMNHNEAQSRSIKIKTNVKAGGYNNHNEIQSCSKRSDELDGKRFGKKLRLAKETIRELKDADLKRIVGGGMAATTSNCGFCSCYRC